MTARDELRLQIRRQREEMSALYVMEMSARIRPSTPMATSVDMGSRRM